MLYELGEKIKELIETIKKAFKKLVTAIHQALCKHKDTELMKRVSTGEYTFQCISGERVYEVCKHCGKVVNTYFLEFEGAGYK